MARFAFVAVGFNLDRQFAYEIPEAHRESLAAGTRAHVMLGPQKIVGYVVSVGDDPQFDGPIRPLLEVLDEKPVFNDGLMRLLRWAAQYYRVPLGELMRKALPPAAGEQVRRYVKLTDAAAEAPLQGPRQKELVAHLRQAGCVSMEELKAAFPTAPAIVLALERKGVVERFCERTFRSVASLMQAAPRPAQLTREQEQAMAAVCDAIGRGGYAPFLLHGVTGSGKTEVYLRCVEAALRKGRTSLVLVPEIALTPQLMALFQARFADRVAILHSGLSKGERYDQWCQVAQGLLPIVLGARSAIFAPLSALGLLVIDEEHEPSFKQDERPYYSARDLALVRARLSDCAVVLGSATPSLESFHNSATGKLRRLSLPRRVTPRPLPDVTLLDLRHTGFADANRIVSKPLAAAMSETLAAGSQMILFLNRKGYASFLVCEVCGHVPQCPNCSVSLTFYQRADELRCHYCDHRVPRPRACPACSKERLERIGFGIERVAQSVLQVLPAARVEMVDSSVSSARKLAEVLERFRRGEVDVLIGTQIVAKGHDFPGVTLVGVLLADLGLNFPDFRAAERTFQLLTQVAGRAGRGDRPGQVYIQTWLPSHYALEHAQCHDFLGFADAELAMRRTRRYPPYACLALLQFSGEELSQVQGTAQTARDVIEETRASHKGLADVIGPGPAPLSLLRNRYRVQLLVRSPDRPSMQAFLDRALPRLHAALPRGRAVKWDVDVDPVNLM